LELKGVKNMEKLYNKLCIFRNVLKFQNDYDYEIYGILTELCFENIIEGNELKEIINNTYKVETEITDNTKLFFCLLKRIKNNDIKEKKLLRKNLHKWVCQKIELIKKEENIKEKKNMFDGWLDN